MLAAVVVLFIFCWTPILVFNLLRGFGVISRYNKGILKPINTASHLLSYLNSALNPLIYGFMSRHFRRSFQAVFTLCFGKSSKKHVRRPPVPQPSSQHFNFGSSKQVTYNLRQSSASNLTSRPSANNLLQLANLTENVMSEEQSEISSPPANECAASAAHKHIIIASNNNSKNVPNLNSKEIKNSIRFETSCHESSTDNI
jgi:hypothetical protein